VLNNEVAMEWEQVYERAVRKVKAKKVKAKKVEAKMKAYPWQ
jgi:hypothetical protein